MDIKQTALDFLEWRNIQKNLENPEYIEENINLISEKLIPSDIAYNLEKMRVGYDSEI